MAGGLSGALLCLSGALAGEYFGASTTYVRSAGMIERAVAPQRVSALEYFVKTKVLIEWQWMFVAGIFFGALLASNLSGDYRAVALPPMWESRFGPKKARRWFIAFLGGAVAMFGARLADG